MLNMHNPKWYESMWQVKGIESQLNVTIFLSDSFRCFCPCHLTHSNISVWFSSERFAVVGIRSFVLSLMSVINIPAGCILYTQQILKE